jgi:hypothetical protein
VVWAAPVCNGWAICALPLTRPAVCFSALFMLNQGHELSVWMVAECPAKWSRCYRPAQTAKSLMQRFCLKSSKTRSAMFAHLRKSTRRFSRQANITPQPGIRGIVFLNCMLKDVIICPTIHPFGVLGGGLDSEIVGATRRRLNFSWGRSRVGNRSTARWR